MLNIPHSRDPLPSREYTSVFSSNGESCSSFAEVEDLGLNLLLIPALLVTMLLSPTLSPALLYSALQCWGWNSANHGHFASCSFLGSSRRGQQRETRRLGDKEGTSYFQLSSCGREQHPALRLHFSSSSSSNRKSVCNFSSTHRTSLIVAPHQRRQHQLITNSFLGVWVTVLWAPAPSF